ncbi:MAG: hypothetical protein OK422_03425 [Thaumarchaeota archaeon]|nr:hypothetical protein [Nitrososphaerota archaeon]
MREHQSKEALQERFREYSRFGKGFEKAIDTALSDNVKKHLFAPSGRVLYTVVGRSGDEFLDPTRPYCSCDDFYFKVLGGQKELCYHILSFRIATEANLVDTITFDDQEYNSILESICRDLLAPNREEERPF